MQDNQWADLLTKAPSRPAARYESSSPRAPLAGFPVTGTASDTSSVSRLHPMSSQAPRARPTSASVRTSSSSGDATHSDKRRGRGAQNDRTRSDRARSATTRSTSMGTEDGHMALVAVTHELANRQQSAIPGEERGSHLAQKQHAHFTKQQASRSHA